MNRPSGVWPAVIAAACAALAALVPAAQARAEVVLGVFAPAADFENTEARIQLGTALAAHLSSNVSRQAVKRRVFVRTADFEKDNQLGLVLVDFAYLLAAPASWQVIAKSSDVSWRLVGGKSVKTMAALRQRATRRLLVATGGNQKLAEQLADAALRGEARSIFTQVMQAPDSASALAALALGKAECALVPSSLAASSGSPELMSLDLGGVPGLVLMATPNVTEAQRQAFAAAALTFPDPVLLPADDRVRESVVAHLSFAPRRGPMAPAPLRELVEMLFVAPQISMPHAALDRFIATPPPLSPSAPAVTRPATAAEEPPSPKGR